MSTPAADSSPSKEAVKGGMQTFSKLRIVKNLVVVGVVCLLLFASGDMALMYQSTLNMEKSVGIISVAVHYAFNIIGSFLFPKYLVLKYGCKAIMLLSIILFMPFFVANYYPLYSLMLISSMLQGVAYALFLGALDPYINCLSSLYVDHQLADLLDKDDGISTQIIASIDKSTGLDTRLPTYTFVGESYQVGDNISEAKYVKDDNSCNQINNETNIFKESNLSNVGNSKVSMNPKDTKTIDKVIAPFKTNHNKTDVLESTTNRFFGFHSMIYQTCYILSNMASFYVLQSGYAEDRPTIYANETCICGASYCNVETPCSEKNLQQPTLEARNILISLCVGLCVLSGVVTIFLDDLERKDRNVSFSLNILLATFREIKKKEHLLLMPMTVNIGLMKGFFLGDFTKSYIGCAWGIQYVGLVTASAGVTMSIFSTVSGWFTKHLGRLPIFLMTAVLNTGLNVILITWKPNSNSPAMFYVTAGLWGAVFGTFNSQVRAFYGVLFKKDEEAAFGAYLFWYCVGSCLCLSYSDYVCNDVKIYFMIAVSTLGTMGYLIVQRSHSLANNQNSSSTPKRNFHTNIQSTDTVTRF